MKARLSLPRRRGLQPDAEPVGVHVVGAEHVARAVPAVVGRALALWSLAWRPARAGRRAQADRPHLVEADHDAVLGCLGVEREHPRGLGLIVGIRAGLPRARALKRQARPGEDAPQVRRRDLDDPLLTQVTREPLERPARGRNPERVGTGTGHRDDPSALLVGDPAGTPAPRLRVQRREPPLVERVNDLAHVRLIAANQRRDLLRTHPRRRRPTDQRPLALDLRRRLAREPLEPVALLRQQIPDEHRRGTHHHLHNRDASQFAAQHAFPVNRYEMGH